MLIVKFLIQTLSRCIVASGAFLDGRSLSLSPLIQ
jgi:hypothetical protein